MVSDDEFQRLPERADRGFADFVQKRVNIQRAFLNEKNVEPVVDQREDGDISVEIVNGVFENIVEDLDIELMIAERTVGVLQRRGGVDEATDDDVVIDRPLQPIAAAGHGQLGERAAVTVYEHVKVGLPELCGLQIGEQLLIKQHAEIQKHLLHDEKGQRRRGFSGKRDHEVGISADALDGVDVELDLLDIVRQADAAADGLVVVLVEAVYMRDSGLDLVLGRVDGFAELAEAVDDQAGLIELCGDELQNLPERNALDDQVIELLLRVERVDQIVVFHVPKKRQKPVIHLAERQVDRNIDQGKADGIRSLYDLGIELVNKPAELDPKPGARQLVQTQDQLAQLFLIFLIGHGGCDNEAIFGNIGDHVRRFRRFDGRDRTIQTRVLIDQGQLLKRWN